MKQSITVCVGTSCHIKGSHHVIDRLGDLIREYNLEDEVELLAAFCMGRCTGNIGAIVNGHDVIDLTQDNVDDIFRREILDQSESGRG